MKTFTYVPRAVVRATGPDTAEFLQGQFSNDLSIEIGRVVYGLWLNRKGKIVADSFVLRRAEDEFIIISYYSSSESIVERLDAYIIMDDVDLQIIETADALTVWGSDLSSALVHSNMDAPTGGMFSYVDDVFVFEGRRGGLRSLEIINLKGGVCDFLLESGDSKAITESEVMDLAIFNNRPIVGAGICNTDLPQEVGLGDSGVAYNKGCYLGQEVMARIKSMGRVRRQLKPASIDFEETGSSVLEILSLVDESGAKSGDFRSLVYREGKRFGFAMAKSGAWNGTLYAVTTNGEKKVLSCL